jgi:valyl-tRNA synthetase
MEKRYLPQEFEDKTYKLWEKSEAFAPKVDKKKTSFTIVMPPPNANAPLHVGHAMFITLEDIMVRYQRMKGTPALLLPGADHAGILTQVVFERKLAKEGKSRFDLGREKFYKQCLKFTLDNKEIMEGQMKKVGASCDWSRDKFTLDPKISKQVLETFVELYKDGLAYRGERLINWCPRCQTALSDLEVEYQEEKSKLWFIKYPLKTHADVTDTTMYLIVATTRPETMLGDTALAVNAADDRYQQFIGKKAVVPLIGREIPVIADKKVDSEFGTGVVKVTPAHDPDDYKMGLDHKLAFIQVIGFDNKMTSKAGKEFKGLKILEARQKILEQLKKLNLLVKERDYRHSVGHCERCKAIIEPLISKQWFINMNAEFRIKNSELKKLLGVEKTSLKQIGTLAVKKRLIKIIPKRFEKNYLNWMENLRDWCVSRQIWWGHRMPIWYCGGQGLSELQKMMNPDLASEVGSEKRESGKKNGCGEIVVSLEKPKKCPKCERKNFVQDPDTLDTWFSSGQWPYNALGFDAKLKSKVNDFDYFYPTSVMETGYEILYFWVARMIMMGLYRTGDIPFRTVYLHGLVRDAFGQKMSKSKGNVVNPLEVISRHGADALRMALVVGATPGNDISVGEEKIKGYRNFTNKIWNIGRFILLNHEWMNIKVARYEDKMKGLTKEDKKIINDLNDLIKEMTALLDEYRFSQAGELIYEFIWHRFADKYIEYTKPRLKANDGAALAVLRHTYLSCLKLLHPFMPFVTEAVWQEMPRKYKDLLILSSWPQADK